MFDFVRNNHKLIQVMLALIAVPFAFWGVDSYVRSTDRSREIASVGGTPINQNEFNQALRQQQDQMRSMLGPRYDAERFDTAESRQALIGALVDNRLLATEAARGKLTLPDEDLRKLILGIGAFQDNGKFSGQRYEDILRSQGMTKTDFEARLRSEQVLHQLNDAIASTAIVSKISVARWQAVNEQEREVSETLFQPAQFLSQVKITPDAVKQYYDANNKIFEEGQQVSAEYLVLSIDTLAQQATASEEDIKSWYDAHFAQFANPGQRQARHILVAVGKTASPADRAKARIKAESLLAQVKKNPTSFAEVAKKNSDDPGSAAKGGDLGAFSRGMMVKPFDDAVFAMKQGEISGIVESDFGFHIIKLDAIVPPSAKSLAEVHAEVEHEVRKLQAQKKFTELAESFSNMVYEQPDSLQPAAERFKLQIQHTGLFGKRNVAAAAPALNNPKMLDALFSDDAIKNKRNTEAIETAPNTLVAARVTQSQPARIRALTEVGPAIELILRTKEASNLARQHAEAALAELQKGGTGSGVADLKWSAPKAVSRQNPLDLKPDSVKAIFSADVTKLPAYAVAEAGEAAHALYRVSAVYQPPVVEVDKRKKREDDLKSTLTREDFEVYLAALRAKSKVVVNKESLERKDR
jgi:peptidyl-prolyl cis-trans isomerase D